VCDTIVFGRLARYEAQGIGYVWAGKPEFERFLAKAGPSKRGPLRDPDAEDMAVNAGRRSAETRNRIGFNQQIQRNIEAALEEEGRRIGAKRYADPSRMEDAGLSAAASEENGQGGVAVVMDV